MPPSFFNFPGEIRNRIYEELLVLSEQPIVISVLNRYIGDGHILHAARVIKYLGKQLHPAILITNKKVHSETAPYLYTCNRFAFYDPTYDMGNTNQDEIVYIFLNVIGHRNACLLRHLCVSFPMFHGTEPGRVRLDENSLRTLQLIRDKCANVTTLETTITSTNEFEFKLSVQRPEVVSEALALADAGFKSITSLKHVVINAHDEPLSASRRKLMYGFGWVIKLQQVRDPNSGRSTT